MGQGTNKCDMTVFLTFDDGIHPGTQDVYEVVKAKGVKATFFLTGAHVRYAVEHDNQRALFNKLRSDINIDLGNHSSSHANSYYYTAYYDKGGVLLNDSKTRRSVLDDFKHCDDTLADLMGYCWDGKKPVFKHARLPGRNTWRVPGLPDVTHGSSIISTGDSQNEADALKAFGYQIYGWDYEWSMDFGGTGIHSDFDPEVDRACTSPTDKDCFGEAESKKSFRFNPAVDRVDYDGEAAASDVLFRFDSWFHGPRKAKKLIVLMHERAFRPYDRPADKYRKYFEDFIEVLKAGGVCFDKISNY